MIRFVLSIFGALFSLFTLGVLMVALTIGGVFWISGRDLPSHESLAQYKPPTISRIYSGEGHLIDEFAHERRLFTPSEEIPDLVPGEPGIFIFEKREELFNILPVGFHCVGGEFFYI